MYMTYIQSDTEILNIRVLYHYIYIFVLFISVH